MSVIIQLRRPTRRAAALLMALPFHGDIGAIADAGITAGFNDRTYRPVAFADRENSTTPESFAISPYSTLTATIAAFGPTGTKLLSLAP